MMPPSENAPDDTTTTSPRLVHTVHGVAGVARLVDYMKDRLALVPVIEVGDLITSGFVTIAIGNNEVGGRTVDLISDGDRISIDASALARLEAAGRWNPPWPYELSIVHEDDELVVVDKPACMHVHPLGDSREHTLVNALVHYAGGRSADPWARWRPHAVQRLDAVVSGLLLIAKSADTKAALVRAQMKREVQRSYRALVIGRVDAEGGVIDSPLGREPGRFRRGVVELDDGGRHAVTRWTTVERFADRTLVELTPETGRTHQLRAHLASIGHPIVGDHLYSLLAPSEAPARFDNAKMTPIALHATRLRLQHPHTQEMLEFESPLPATFGRT